MSVVLCLPAHLCVSPQRPVAGPPRERVTGPTDFHYGSRGIPAAYRHPGTLGPHEPYPSGPRVTVNDTILGSVVEDRENRKHLARRVGTVDDMEDIVSVCERIRRKLCHLRVPAEDSDEEVRSCSTGSKARRYRKRGSPKPPKKDWESAMDMTPSPSPDVQCSVGLRGISYLLPFRWSRRRARFLGGALKYRPKF